ncbi:MAG: hypothetical protein KIPDCIKN_00636 [Haliscomenobacter sp.]|nr:hypothetical protein [Haliscomenobacter sp.]
MDLLLQIWHIDTRMIIMLKKLQNAKVTSTKMVGLPMLSKIFKQIQMEKSTVE